MRIYEIQLLNLLYPHDRSDPPQSKSDTKVAKLKQTMHSVNFHFTKQRLDLITPRSC